VELTINFDVERERSLADIVLGNAGIFAFVHRTGTGNFQRFRVVFNDLRLMGPLDTDRRVGVDATLERDRVVLSYADLTVRREGCDLWGGYNEVIRARRERSLMNC